MLNRAEDVGVESGASKWFGRAWQRIVGSAWGPLAGKAAAYVAGFAMLALVGSGKLGQWLSPPGRVVVGVPIAEAAAAEPTGTARPPAPTSPPPAPTAAPDAGASEAPADAGATSAIAPDGKVILNLAAEEDLRRLPGVGPTRAKAILALRARLGKFKRPEDLLRVKGIGRRSLARLRPLVRID
jgi:competence protein ComEA